MSDRLPVKPKSTLLTDPVASRLLARASELDAAQRMGVDVAGLRAAAQEAGISMHAFDAAVAEMEGEAQAPVPDVVKAPRRQWTLAVGVALAFLLVISAYVFPRTLARVAPVPPVIEQQLLLRCLSPDQAAALIRPILSLPENTIVFSPGTAPQLLTIHGTPAQIDRVIQLLQQYEPPGTASCPTVRP